MSKISKYIGGIHDSGATLTEDQINAMAHLSDVGTSHMMLLDTRGDDSVLFVDCDQDDNQFFGEVMMRVDASGLIYTGTGLHIASMGLCDGMWKINWVETDELAHTIDHPGFPDAEMMRRFGLEPHFRCELRFFEEFMKFMSLPV